jgi:hypothetical protein
MRKFSDITEASGKIVFAFGRFNPPTIGHEKLITKVASISGSDPYRIYPSLTQNSKKDPLPHALKVAYMRKMFSKHSKNIIAEKKAVTAIDIAVKLYDEGYRDLVMVAGSDRIKEFESMFNKYNGVTGKRHGYYKFNTIDVVSAGERDPDAEGVSGMSASKMRTAAVEGDNKSFMMGLPKGFKDGEKLFQDVRKYMGIREDKDMGSMTDYESVRDAYLTGKVWNVGDLIEANGITGIIIRKGTNYVSYNDGNGKVHKAWLHDITLDERNYAKEYANYQGTPEQIARRSSRNKARRIMGDKATQGMDVGHKDNNPLNNDPNNLKMEDPSKNRREPRLREEDDLDENPFAGGMLDPTPFIAKLRGKLDTRVISTVLKKYKDGVDKGEDKGGNAARDGRNSKNKLIADIVLQYGLERKYGMNTREVIKYINKLVSKGKVNKKYTVEVKQDPDIEDGKGTEPAKYYAKDAEGKGMSVSTKKARDTHFTKKKKGPAPGDASAKTKSSTHTKKFKQMYGEESLNEKRAKQAVNSRGKVQRYVTAHNLKFKGKQYKEIDMELVKINNSTEMVTFKIIGPKELFGNETNISFKALRRGPFMATNIPNAFEVLDKNADMGDYIDDFEKSDSPQFKGKSKEKRKDMAIAAYLSRNEQMEINEKIEGLVNKAKKSGMPYGILKKVYDRGMAAYKTGHRPGTTSQQWAFARVNSFITKSSGTWGKADKDLADKVRASEAVSPAQQAAIAISKKKKADEKSVNEWFEANTTRAKYQLQHGDDWWWKMNETHDAMLEKLGLCCDDCITEEELPCPPATKDVKINTKNRDATIKNHNYGPLNVDEPGDYFEKIAKYWKTTEEAAKKSLCGNCVAFDISPRMNECLPGETSDGDGVLGYCHMHHFKCHSARSCHTWAKGGPIKSDEKSYDWQSRGQKESVKEAKGPCWDGFKQVGMKMKGGKQVPNCVPEEVELDEMLDYAIIDGDNIIIGLYKGSNAKKQAQINMKGAEKQVQIKKPVKIVPVSNKKKGDTVIGIGESKLVKFNQFESLNAWGEVTEEDKSGKKLNNPTRGDVKKYKVYVKNDKGNVVKVEFGDPNMSIKRDDPARRKSFRARHNCENPGPKYKARYWSCKFWSTKSVTDLMKG